MALSPEVEAALIIVAGIWTAELKDVEPRYRKDALATWINRYETIHDYLKRKFEAE